MQIKKLQTQVLKRLRECNIGEVRLYPVSVFTEQMLDKYNLPDYLLNQGISVNYGLQQEGKYTDNEAIVTIGTQYGLPMNQQTNLLKAGKVQNVLVVGISTHNHSIGDIKWLKIKEYEK